MPISKYFKDHGEEVMASMQKTYKSPAKAKRVFYATANKARGGVTKRTPRKWGD